MKGYNMGQINRGTNWNQIINSAKEKKSDEKLKKSLTGKKTNPTLDPTTTIFNKGERS